MMHQRSHNINYHHISETMFWMKGSTQRSQLTVELQLEKARKPNMIRARFEFQDQRVAVRVVAV